jgi:hypothetical protein
MKATIKIGTLLFEKGKFQKGDVIEVTEEEAKRLKDSIMILPEEPALIPVAAAKVETAQTPITPPVTVKDAPLEEPAKKVSSAFTKKTTVTQTQNSSSA